MEFRDLLRDSFELLRAEAPRAGGITLGFGLASSAISVYSPLAEWTFSGASFFFWLAFAFVLTALESALILSLLMPHAFGEARLEPDTLVQEALKRWLPIALVTLATNALMVLGFAALIIPGILVMLWFFVASAVVVRENVSPMAAMSRSAQLTAGHRSTLFCASFLLFLPGMAVSLPTETLPVGANPAAIGLETLAAILYLPLNACAVAAYAALRKLDDLAEEASRAISPAV